MKKFGGLKNFILIATLLGYGNLLGSVEENETSGKDPFEGTLFDSCEFFNDLNLKGDVLEDGFTKMSHITYQRFPVRKWKIEEKRERIQKANHLEPNISNLKEYYKILDNDLNRLKENTEIRKNLETYLYYIELWDILDYALDLHEIFSELLKEGYFHLEHGIAKEVLERSVVVNSRIERLLNFALTTVVKVEFGHNAFFKTEQVSSIINTNFELLYRTGQLPYYIVLNLIELDELLFKIFKACELYSSEEREESSKEVLNFIESLYRVTTELETTR